MQPQHLKQRPFHRNCPVCIEWASTGGKARFSLPVRASWHVGRPSLFPLRMMRIKGETGCSDASAERLGGTWVPGAKNSALPLLAASLLCTQAVALENVPGLTDVACAVHILRALGCGVRGPHKGVVDVLPASEPGSTVPQEDMCAMRSSLFFLAGVHWPAWRL